MDANFNQEESLQVDLRQYIALLWRWSWLIVLATLLSGGAAFVVSQFQDPVYQTTTTLLINEATTTAQTSDYTAILTSERLARTYSEMLTKRPILETVMETLDLDSVYQDLEQMRDVITVQLVRDTQLIELSVEDTDPERAALIANALVEIFAKQNQALQASRFAESKTSLEGQLDRLNGQIHNTVTTIDNLENNAENQNEITRLETELVQYRQTYSQILQSYEQIRVSEAQATSNVAQVEPANVPEEPIRPRIMMNTVLAAVVGAMLAVGAIFLVEALDDTLKNPAEINRMLDLPVLGTIFRHDVQAGQPISSASPRSTTTEAFRALRTNIQYASIDFPIRNLLVTSPTAGVGKTTVTANLGTVLAQGGKRTVLIDADMRRPALHRLFNLSNRLGLSSFFVFQSNLDKVEIPKDYIQPLKTDGLKVITAGKIPPNPAELLASDKMNALIQQMQSENEVVLIDSPPVMAVTDAAILATRVDGILLVVKPGYTKREAARQTVEQLRRVGANLIGVVLNEVDPRSGKYGYYYNTYQEYDYGSKEELPKKSGLFGRGWSKAALAGIAALTLTLGCWFVLTRIRPQEGPQPVDSPTAAIPTAMSTGSAVLTMDAQATSDLAHDQNPTETKKPTYGLTSVPATVEATRPVIPTSTIRVTDKVLSTSSAETQEPESSPTPEKLTPGPSLGTPFGGLDEYLLHQVKYGDNLPALSKTYRTNRDVIIALNGLLPNQSLQPDQVIVIKPDWNTTLEIVPLMVLYLDADITVQELAARYGATIDELVEYNDLGSNNYLPAGRWLILPKREITPTATPTIIVTPDLSNALKGPFGPDDAYILHQVISGESIPMLSKMYLTSADVIYAANKIEGSIQLNSILVIFPGIEDAAGISQFEIEFVVQDIRIQELADNLGVLRSELEFHNDLAGNENIPAGSWIIYPSPPEN